MYAKSVVVNFYFFFFLLEIKFGSKLGVAEVDDQTEQRFLVSGKRLILLFFINIVRFINFSVLNV